jgi:hypothetical protein
MQPYKNLWTTLDIESHINASLQLLPEAAATQERRLEAVRCSPMLDRLFNDRRYATDYPKNSEHQIHRPKASRI